jgi:hypothetical protein
MAHWPRGWVTSGVHTLLLGTDNGNLLLAHPVSGSVRRAVELTGLIPAGGWFPGRLGGASWDRVRSGARKGAVGPRAFTPPAFGASAVPLPASSSAAPDRHCRMVTGGGWLCTLHRAMRPGYAVHTCS